MSVVSLIVVGNSPRVMAAVGSAVRQTPPAHEVLLIEPPHRALSSGQRHALGRDGIRVIRPAEAQNGAALRNAGVRASCGVWIGLLGPDDELAPGFLAAAMAAVDGAAFVTTGSNWPGGLDVRPAGLEVTLAAALRDPELVHSCALFRRDLWDQVGGFDETLDDLEVYDFWLRVLATGARGKALPEVLVRRRVSDATHARASRAPAAAAAALARHREPFTGAMAEVLLARERRLDALRGVQAALRAREAATVRERSALDGAVGEAAAALRREGRQRFDWGDFNRLSPISAEWGADRGRCIDRYYIEQFVESQAADVHGHVLEVHDDDYTRAYGGARVVRSDVLDIDPVNPRATVIADLRQAHAIASASYDCVILTQTLHVIYDVRAVLRECARILKSGGVLLATLPCASRLAPEQGPDGDFWRFTPSAARRLFEESFAPDRVDVRAYGNVLVNIAFLYGLACHEITEREFEVHDPYFPALIAVRARA